MVVAVIWVDTSMTDLMGRRHTYAPTLCCEEAYASDEVEVFHPHVL